MDELYCIPYHPVGSDRWELEWGRFPGRWSLACQECGSVRWDFIEEINDIGYKTLLEHFGLWERHDEFMPWDQKLKFMSPAQLKFIADKKDGPTPESRLYFYLTNNCGKCYYKNINP